MADCKIPNYDTGVFCFRIIVISQVVYQSVVFVVDNELKCSRSAKEAVDHLPWRRRA